MDRVRTVSIHLTHHTHPQQSKLIIRSAVSGYMKSTLRPSFVAAVVLGHLFWRCFQELVGGGWGQISDICFRPARLWSTEYGIHRNHLGTSFKFIFLVLTKPNPAVLHKLAQMFLTYETKHHSFKGLLLSPHLQRWYLVSRGEWSNLGTKTIFLRTSKEHQGLKWT